jgi:hypothetical protein
MDQYELIRTASRVYHKSIRQIARETGHCRKTIRKVLQFNSLGVGPSQPIEILVDHRKRG